MDPTSAVRTDALPAIATVIAPGAFASTPYVWATIATHSEVSGFLNQHEAITVAAAILLWTATGFAIDSAGTYLEYHRIDQQRNDRADFTETWWQFLRTAWTIEPVGHRYLRRLLVSFKFELNMCVAVMVATPGLLLLAAYQQVSWGRGAIGSIVMMIAAYVLFRAARTSSGVLADTRRHLVQGVTVRPTESNAQ